MTEVAMAGPGLGPRARRVYDALRERILTGELSGDIQLPPYPLLAQEFGVASMTVRQALRQLAEDGFVSIKVGVGSFVRGVNVRPRVLIVDGDDSARGPLRAMLNAV